MAAIEQLIKWIKGIHKWYAISDKKPENHSQVYVKLHDRVFDENFEQLTFVQGHDDFPSDYWIRTYRMDGSRKRIIVDKHDMWRFVE